MRKKSTIAVLFISAMLSAVGFYLYLDTDVQMAFAPPSPTVSSDPPPPPIFVPSLAPPVSPASEPAGKTSDACKRYPQLCDDEVRSTAATPITLDEALDKLRLAKIAFNTPDKGTLGQQFAVEAKISPRLTEAEMKVRIEEPGKIEIATLKIADRMVATLSGGSAFDITATGPKEQWISDRDTTDWLWQVSPKTEGRQVLVLNIEAIISLNGKEDRRSINSFKRYIGVEIGRPKSISEWLEYIKKNGENISWIWVTLLLPIGGLAWSWIKRKFTASDTTNTG